MRLALPNEVLGIPIRHIVAYDISSNPNAVYIHNFHNPSTAMQQPLHASNNQLRNILVEGLRVEDVDNQADIWTMSPPCQPCKFICSLSFYLKYSHLLVYWLDFVCLFI